MLPMLLLGLVFLGAVLSPVSAVPLRRQKQQLTFVDAKQSEILRGESFSPLPAESGDMLQEMTSFVHPQRARCLTKRFWSLPVARPTKSRCCSVTRQPPW